MKEIEIIKDSARATDIYGDNASVLANISDMLEYDMLRYDKLIFSEGDAYEY